MQDVRMRRSQHKGAFLLVEGSTDAKRFKKLLDHQCEPVNCFGKPNATDATIGLYEDGFSGIIGMIDADFDRITKSAVSHEGICISEGHDFEVDWIRSSALHRYLDVVADKSAVKDVGGVKAVAEYIMLGILPLSVLRYVNEVKSLGYRLKDLNLEEFYDGIKCEVEKLVESVSKGAFGTSIHKESLKSHIKTGVTTKWPLEQITSGHDFCEALGIALRTSLGNRKAPQSWGDEIEMHVRLAYDFSDFAKSSTYAFLCKWENDNDPYRIVKTEK